MSPDARTVAARGWTGWDWDGAASIYFFDVPSGELVHRVCGFKDAVNALVWTRDGRHLLVGLQARGGLHRLRLSDYRVVASDFDYQDKIMEIDERHDGLAAVVSLDGMARLYDREFRLLGRRAVPGGAKPSSARFSPDGRWLAVGFIDRPALTVLQARDLGEAYRPGTDGMKDQASFTSVARAFARHRSATDPPGIPPDGLLPHRPKRARPYLYSDDEIRGLLRAALKLPSHGGLRPWTYHCLFGLVSVSGLRLGEACHLELQDVDLGAAALTIRGAKFGKSRLVPLHASTRHVLADYLARRERLWSARPVSSYVFVSNRGNRLDGGEIHRTFYALSRQIGLRGLSDRHGPRLHDLRHRFAVTTLLRWSRAGEDAERRLPILSAYLGHVHVSDTFWYLSGPALTA